MNDDKGYALSEDWEERDRSDDDASDDDPGMSKYTGGAHFNAPHTANRNGLHPGVTDYASWETATRYDDDGENAVDYDDAEDDYDDGDTRW